MPRPALRSRSLRRTKVTTPSGRKVRRETKHDSSLSLEEIEKRKAELSAFLDENPNASYDDFVRRGLKPVYKVFRSLERAKRVTGHSDLIRDPGGLSPREKGTKIDQLFTYLDSNPDATWEKLIAEGYERHLRLFGRKVTRVRTAYRFDRQKDPLPKIGDYSAENVARLLMRINQGPLLDELLTSMEPSERDRLEEMLNSERQKLLEYLRDHPHHIYLQLIGAGYALPLNVFYTSHRETAEVDVKIDAGVVPVIELDDVSENGGIKPGEGVRDAFLEYLTSQQGIGRRLTPDDVYFSGFGPVFDHFYGGDVWLAYTHAEARKRSPNWKVEINANGVGTYA